MSAAQTGPQETPGADHGTEARGWWSGVPLALVSRPDVGSTPTLTSTRQAGIWAPGQTYPRLSCQGKRVSPEKLQPSQLKRAFSEPWLPRCGRECPLVQPHLPLCLARQTRPAQVAEKDSLSPGTNKPAPCVVRKPFLGWPAMSLGGQATCPEATSGSNRKACRPQPPPMSPDLVSCPAPAPRGAGCHTASWEECAGKTRSDKENATSSTQLSPQARPSQPSPQSHHLATFYLQSNRWVLLQSPTQPLHPLPGGRPAQRVAFLGRWHPQQRAGFVPEAGDLPRGPKAAVYARPIPWPGSRAPPGSKTGA